MLHKYKLNLVFLILKTIFL